MVVTTPALADTLKMLNQQYHQQKYHAAYTGGLAYIKQHPLNPSGQLLLADSAYQLGYLDEAMAAYDRVLILAPNNIYAQVQQAKIHAQYGYYELSILALRALAKQDLTLKQQQKVAALIQQVKQQHSQDTRFKAKTTPMAINLQLGVLFDSNANADIGDKSVKIPAYNLNYQGSTEKQKIAAFMGASVDKNQRISKNIGLFSMLGAYHKNYIPNTQTDDLSYVFAYFAPQYFIQNSQIDLPISLNKVWLDYHGYLHNYSLGVKFKTPMSQGEVEAGYTYALSRFNAANQSRNANNQRVYLGFKQTLSKQTLAHFYWHYAYNQEQQDLRTDINYNAYGFNVGVMHKPINQLKVKASLGFNSEYYSDYNRVFLSHRADKTYQFNLGLVYALSQYSALNLDINYRIKNSNQFLYNYNKLVIPFSYSHRF